ncbi:hypothetical protein GCM10009839_17040 [Catenulispora yoronensis]|uniref:Uncharacterized protein n=1 Tax=Catenulispora yoronensis TaxID=450799 RepID=A0ABN2TTB6_9ACTN
MGDHAVSDDEDSAQRGAHDPKVQPGDYPSASAVLHAIETARIAAPARCEEIDRHPRHRGAGITGNASPVGTIRSSHAGCGGGVHTLTLVGARLPAPRGRYPRATETSHRRLRE